MKVIPSMKARLPSSERARPRSLGLCQWLAPRSFFTALLAAIAALAALGLAVPTASWAQQTGTISGTVTADDTGDSLPGVNLVVLGTELGGSTGGDGTYEITGVEPGTYTLRATFIGYADEREENIEVVAGETTVVDITMQPQAESLDEVVITGYGGEQQRRDLTGSISTVSAEEIEDLAVSGIDEALQGQAPGVRVQSYTGAPSGGTNITVRGLGTITAGNQPLYVIDGIPMGNNSGQGMESNPLASINPQDIESMEILKGASATAIYGSRGANGVVLITTKKGRDGETRINFSSSVGMSTLFNKLDLVNGRQSGIYRREARNYDYVESNPVYNRPYHPNPEDAPPGMLGRNCCWRADFYDEIINQNREGTDWQEAIFRPAPRQEYTLSASGGNEVTRFFISGGYLDQQGIIEGSGFKRYSARINVDATLNDWAEVGINFSPSYTRGRGSEAQGHPLFGIVQQAIDGEPHDAIRNIDGTYSTETDFGPQAGSNNYYNPIAELGRNRNLQQRMRGTGNIFAEIALTEGLDFRSEVGIDYNSVRSNSYDRAEAQRHLNTDQASSSTRFNLNWVTENTLTYNRVFGQNHDLTVLGGVTAQRDHSEVNGVEATDFPNSLVPVLDAGSVTDGGSSESNWALLSGLSRINYAYANKYLFTGTVRADGSSKFGADRRWGVFPSVALSWVASREPFVQQIPVLSFLKIRTSYGLSGNDQIGNYSHISTLAGPGGGSGNYVFGDELAGGLYPGNIPNEELTWEPSRQVDVGLDLGFFSDRINFTADYYSRTSYDLLLDVPVPEVTGFSSTLKNVGKVRNSGWELSVESRNLTGNLVDGLTWTTNANISFNDNEVLELGPDDAPVRAGTWFGNTHITAVGHPISSFYGYEVDGVFQNWEEVEEGPVWHQNQDERYEGSRPGSLRYVDQNGDGVIDGNDQTILDGPQPDFFYGMTNTLRYKNFDLRVLIQGVEGQRVLNQTRRGNNSEYAYQFESRFRTIDNPGANDVPFFSDSEGDAGFSEYFIEDASYLAVRDIRLGFRLPESWAGSVAERARIYGGVRNPFIFSDYTGYNPDVNAYQGPGGGGANATKQGVDGGSYPTQTVYRLGLNVRF